MVGFAGGRVLIARPCSLPAAYEKAPSRKSARIPTLSAVRNPAEAHDLHRRNELRCQPIEYALHLAPLAPHIPQPLPGECRAVCLTLPQG
jgi:hypothetical protein